MPSNEENRLEALRIYNVLDTAPEDRFDGLAKLASYICNTPVALVSLVDKDRLWFKAKVGLEAPQLPRDRSFCEHAIAQPDSLFIVPDATQDARFAANPLVTCAPHIRFYAGAPLVTPEGQLLGTLCVIDTVPRELNLPQQEALRTLAYQVVTQLEIHHKINKLEESDENLHRSLIQLQTLSVTDSLTGLKNRRAFEERLNEEFSRARRYDTPLSFLLLDVDRFKQYNDTFGHLAGDELLQSLARLLEEKNRTDDFVARYGGEEFAVILPNTDLESALVIAERCRSEAEKLHHQLTISIGVSTMNAKMSNPNALVAAADMALYDAKDNGRNRVEVYAGRVMPSPLKPPTT